MVSLRRWCLSRHLSPHTPRHLPPVQTLSSRLWAPDANSTSSPRSILTPSLCGWREVPVSLALKPFLPSLCLPQLCLWPHYLLKDGRKREGVGRAREEASQIEGAVSTKAQGPARSSWRGGIERRSGTASPRWPRSQPGRSPPQHYPPWPAHLLPGLPTGGTGLKARAKSANTWRDEPVNSHWGTAGGRVPHMQEWLLLDSARLLCEASQALCCLPLCFWMKSGIVMWNKLASFKKKKYWQKYNLKK